MRRGMSYSRLFLCVQTFLYLALDSRQTLTRSSIIEHDAKPREPLGYYFKGTLAIEAELNKIDVFPESCVVA